MKYDILSRSFIDIEGEKASSFLQGLITQDIHTVTQERPRYSLMLNPQGRFVFDFFISKYDQGYRLECAADRVPDLLRRLQAYALRSSITIKGGPAYCVIVGPGSIPESLSINTICFSFPDPRCLKLGWRAYVSDLSAYASCWDYDYHRTALGVPEGKNLIIDKSIPLECWMEELNALSFTKGCYLGQELTARTKHRGDVRKRLFSGVLSDPAAVGSSVYLGAEKVGTLHSVQGLQVFARLYEKNVEPALQAGDLFTVEGSTLTLYCPGFL